VLRLWSQALPYDRGRNRPEDFFPLRVRVALPAITAEMAGLARIFHRSSDPVSGGWIDVREEAQADGLLKD